MKKTQAFEKYVNPIFIIRNGLMRYMKKIPIDEARYDYKLDSYEDEQLLRTGICKNLMLTISNVMNFDEIKKEYNTQMLTLVSSNYNYSEFQSKKARYNHKLLSFAKLMNCIEKYIEDVYIRDNDLKIAGILIYLYDKLSKFQTEKYPNKTTVTSNRQKIYKYIKEASLEELGIDIKKYSNLSIFNLIEKLFNNILYYEFEEENIVTEPILVVNNNTPKIHDHDIFSIEDDDSFEKYKKQREEEIYDWLVKEMHTLPDGRIF